MAKLRERMSEEGILISDGATGTFLQQAGLPPGMAPERWNLENPDAIRAMHRAYIQAGSDVILTNSFGGTYLRLKEDGLDSRVHEINLTAARLARAEAGEDGLVLGDIGPTGQLFEPMGMLNYEKAVAAFGEQAAALAEGGVDGIVIETMSDLSEAAAAVEGAKTCTGLPVLVSMSFDTHGRTMMGVKPVDAVKKLWPMGVDAVGANCGRTLSENLEAVRLMREALPDATLTVKPNAGLPHMEDQEIVFDVTPEVMAEYALLFAELGVKIMGGCCGSTPAHIRAIAQALA